jgi:primosomal protein N' (replication factor Y)
MTPAEPIIAVWPLAGFDKLLHYRAPAKLVPLLRPGVLVRMPILNRQHVGVVQAVDVVPDVPAARLKFLGAVVHTHPVLTPDLMKLGEWMSAYYGASREAVVEAMVPAPVRRGVQARTEKFLVRGATVPSAEELAKLEKRARKQHALLAFLHQQLQPVKKSVVLSRLGVPAAACAALVARGWVREEVRAVDRVAYADDFAHTEVVPTRTVLLNPEQAVAAAAIRESLATGRFLVQLLCGVTGSGKTEVYLDAMQAALAAGGSVIFLVPEVALTPQTVGRLRARLSSLGVSDIVVWHSHLSDGERLDAWDALASGRARVVVGARSAVFAPLPHLKLIVVDEEHEPAYKQDETPRYHGRDVAVYRAMLNDAVCVLGSATPSVESWVNASSGKYRLLRLTKRVDDRQLPVIHVTDMRKEVLKRRGPSVLSSILADKLLGRFERREQSILFINRRGYSRSMVCQECGHVVECEHCSIAMTYHRVDETLRCHLCGDAKEAPVRCPACRSPKIRWPGLGTQKVEQIVQRLLPHARVVRMDTDAMSQKNRFRQVLADFRVGKIDVLVGTQMIGKGLDFPNVTLVGLVDADLSLHVPDFRANERTFQLIVQVAGRAGRGDLAGEVVVQTFTPHAMPIQFGRQADVDAFLAEEIRSREAHAYPPFRHLLLHVFRGPNAEKVAFFAEHWAKKVGDAAGDLAELRGPAPCAIEKIKDHYRYQIWYFTKQVTKFNALLATLQKDFPLPDDVISTIDVDPMNVG